MNEKYKKILNEIDDEHAYDTIKHKNSRILIIDGLNTFIRCWSSIPTMNDNGEHIGGVTGTLRAIAGVIRSVKPSRVIVVFDGSGGSQTRKNISSDYKSTRNKNKLRVNRQYADMMSDEDERVSMKRQYIWLAELLSVLPVTTMIYNGVEADDVMAYIATKLRLPEDEAVIMSTDKDFLQLINDKVSVWSPTKKILYTPDKLKEDYGISSKNFLLYRILDGDVSDNISGVKGVGIKTLIKRIPEIAGDEKISVEDLIEIVKSKTAKIKLYDTLLNSVDTLLMNERLMQLHDVDIDGSIKMNILSQFDEKIIKLVKLDFFQVAMKHQMLNSFGDVNAWLHTSFSTLVTD